MTRGYQQLRDLLRGEGEEACGVTGLVDKGCRGLSI